MALVYQTYPHPGFDDRLITSKPEGMGWNNLGLRSPTHVFLHRMIGSLHGTDQWFRNPTVSALTDYGIGVAAMDGTNLAGTIYRWVDPMGYVTPWASGPVDEPYGDALTMLQYYGYYDAVNKNGVAIEISGNEDTPIDDFAFSELAKLCAYWGDQFKFPYNDLHHSPRTGAALLIWHEEATYGSGKRCPFDVVKARTDELYECISIELMPYQTGGEQLPEPITPEEEDPLADLPKSDYILDPNLIWEDASSGAVGKLWRDYGEATGIFNPPGQPWNDPIEDGGKLYQFEGGPLIATDKQGKAGIVVKVK